MENFVVSARKYRPTTFDSVVGQQHITHTLKNAIKSNHLAQAFLFCGPRGVGKTTCARILAKTINCQYLTTDNEACGVCETCVSSKNGTSFSIYELDAASNNSVDDIKHVIEQVRIPPQTGKYKVYIIDEVHMLSQAAFNAFLKTLEEPPSYAIFILATTEKHKILPTILSRCQIFDFNRIKVEDMANHLALIAQKEQIQYEIDGLHIIAQKADGGLRDALSMFDQIVSFSGGNITYKAVIDNLNILDYDYYFKLTEHLLSENIAQVLLLFDKVLSNGFDGGNFLSGYGAHLRNLLMCKDESTVKLIEVSEGVKQKYISQSQQSSASFLISGMSIVNQCELHYKSSKNPRLQVELTLIKLANLKHLLQINKLNLGTEITSEEKKNDKLEPLQQSPIINPQPATAPVVTLSSPSSSTSAPVKAENSKVFVPKTIVEDDIISIPKLDELDTVVTQSKTKLPEDDLLSGTGTETISEESFMKAWNFCVENARKEGKSSLVTIMDVKPKLLPDFGIEVSVENGIQENVLQTERIDILNYLRSTLNNYALEIRIKKEERQLEKNYYTNTEKYQFMVEKNPDLNLLKQRLGLEIDL